jgi:hypothetical protein
LASKALRITHRASAARRRMRVRSWGETSAHRDLAALLPALASEVVMTPKLRALLKVSAPRSPRATAWVFPLCHDFATSWCIIEHSRAMPGTLTRRSQPPKTMP